MADAIKEDIKKAYNESQDFKDYVDAFAFSTRKSVDAALNCKVVELVYKFYRERR